MKIKAQWFGFLIVAVLLIPHQPDRAGGRNRPIADTTAIARPDRPGAYCLRVSDLDQEVNFFGKMGFEEAFSNVENGHTLQVFIKVNDMQFIEIYPQSDPPQPLGFMHACYESV